jgi:hypothetical protein
MSPFWRNFEANGKSRCESVNDLRENLAQACEDFAFSDLSIGYKRNILLKELNRLLIHYRDVSNWPGQ